MSSQQSMFHDGPISLIEIEGRDVIKTNEIAMKLLQAIDPNLKICVVCVCGVYRSGKSSLMNWLLGIDTWSSSTAGAMTGFTVGPTNIACTKGIWMWGD